jgi:O-antigen/teichoic acid export membrane protein
MTALGRGKFMLVSNFFALLIALTLAFALIPPLGALGAALSVALSFLAHNLLQLFGLRGANILRFDTHTLALFAQTGIAFAALAIGQQYLGLPSIPAGVLVVIAFLVILRLNRKVLELGATFPELSRLPIARWFVGV